MVVFDLDIYAKAQQIRWSSKVLQGRLVRLGEFHTAMCFLGIIGKRMTMSGFEDLVIEAELAAQGSLNGVMNGHMYNRAIRTHKIMSEALRRAQIQQFLRQSDESLSNINQDQLNDSISPYTTSRKIDPDRAVTSTQAFKDYIAAQSQCNLTFTYWNTYLELVHILLNIIRAI